MDALTCHLCRVVCGQRDPAVAPFLHGGDTAAAVLLSLHAAGMASQLAGCWP